MSQVYGHAQFASEPSCSYQAASFLDLTIELRTNKNNNNNQIRKEGANKQTHKQT